MKATVYSIPRLILKQAAVVEPITLGDMWADLEDGLFRFVYCPENADLGDLFFTDAFQCQDDLSLLNVCTRERWEIDNDDAPVIRVPDLGVERPFFRPPKDLRRKRKKINTRKLGLKRPVKAKTPWPRQKRPLRWSDRVRSCVIHYHNGSNGRVRKV